MSTISGGGKDGYSAVKRKAGGNTRPRRLWGNLRHKLEDILVIGLATLLCNGSDFEDMEAFGQEREKRKECGPCSKRVGRGRRNRA
jgi:hypothetical protein